jgi:hypothetical protein
MHLTNEPNNIRGTDEFIFSDRSDIQIANTQIETLYKSMSRLLPA